ncbi:MAG: hypothetical protein D4R38_02695 [Dehalococcoidia bacterium]|nr:MAG: hypothetical protein D4R38_02695 [Dehalococcoidia bacterium]
MSGKRLIRFRKTGEFAYVHPRSADWLRVQALNKAYTDRILSTKGCPRWAKTVGFNYPVLKDQVKKPRQPVEAFGVTPATYSGKCK